MYKRFIQIAAKALKVLACVAISTSSIAGTVLDRIQSDGQLRVCIWPNYYGISFRNPRDGQLRGIDIELSAVLAKTLGVSLQYVDSSFASLIEDLTNDRCDVAMFGVGITPQRQLSLRFTQPYLSSGIYGVTARGSRLVRSWEDIDQPGVRVAVQGGTFMEPVMVNTLKKAEIVRILPPLTREEELESGRVDVFMTDFPYSRRLLDNADWARLISPPKPFNPVPYAYAVKPGDDDWLSRLDSFVADIKRDGRLLAAARRVGLAEIVVRD